MGDPFVSRDHTPKSRDQTEGNDDDTEPGQGMHPMRKRKKRRIRHCRMLLKGRCPLPRKKAVALFELEFGMGHDTARSMIETFKDADVVEEDADGTLRYTEDD